MFAMAGGSANHSLLAARIGALLYRQVPPECRTFDAGLRIKVASARTLYLPGLQRGLRRTTVFRRPEGRHSQSAAARRVLSPSTEGYDRGKKFELYRTIESFREYLIVRQDGRHVEHYSKQDDGSWLLREHSGTEGAVVVARLGVRISLADLYASALDLSR